MRVIIHAGANKTGSTSLQSSLAANRQVLREAGFFYPKFPGSELGEHWQLSALWQDDFDEIHEGYLRRRIDLFGGGTLAEDVRRNLNKLFRELEKTEAIVILSSEALGGDRATKGLRRLRNIISRFTDQIDVLIYVRPQHELFPSAVQHRMKSLTLPLTNEIQPHDINVKRLRVVFGDKVRVRIFLKNLLSEQDVSADFAMWVQRITGSRMPEMKKTPRDNESISAPGCAILLRLKEQLGPEADQKVYFQTCRLLREHMASQGGTRLTLPAGWMERICAGVHKEWNRLVVVSDHTDEEKILARMKPFQSTSDISVQEIRDWVHGYHDPEYVEEVLLYARGRREAWARKAEAYLQIARTLFC